MTRQSEGGWKAAIPPIKENKSSPGTPPTFPGGRAKKNLLV